MKKLVAVAMLLIMVIGVAEVMAFCGFYVAKADTKLFNNRSQIILVRDGNRSIITMANDFQGDVKDFAMVVPVPVVLGEGDIKVVNRAIFDKLDAYSAPRLVEYYDHNPCQRIYYEMAEESKADMSNESLRSISKMADKEKDLGVTIEAKYNIGEYDILLLSAKESTGLKIWLNQNGYKIPNTANEVLDPYIRNNMKFFVVKVNLDKMKNMGYNYLRPIQIAFNSDRFMLPIRLGMANANGPQDMTVFAFTRQGRVETTNYRTAKIPTDRNIPLYVQKDFGKFYVDLFDKAYEREGKNAVFLEYAWNVSPNQGVKCDPCVSPPPIFTEFREAGVHWAQDMSANSNTFFTRLHVRYTRDQFPQDLFFQVTPNREHFQGRYILTHPAKGDLSCNSGQKYLFDLCNKRQKELFELANLTGWRIDNRQDYIREYARYIEDDDVREKYMNPVLDNNPGDGNGFGWKLACFLLGLALVIFVLLKIKIQILPRETSDIKP